MDTFSIDVSEIKQYKACMRQWQYESKNTLGCVFPAKGEALRLGTEYHKALAVMYQTLGRRYNEVQFALTGMDPRIKWMAERYFDYVLPADLELFKVIKTELLFTYSIRDMLGTGLVSGEFRGAIDLVVQDKYTGLIWGMEHKTATRPRINLDDIAQDDQLLAYMRVLELAYPSSKIGGMILSEALKPSKALKDKPLQLQRFIVLYDKDKLDRWLIDTAEVVHEIKKNAEEIKKAKVIELLPRNAKNFSCNYCRVRHLCDYWGLRSEMPCAELEEILELFGGVISFVHHLDQREK